MDPATIALLAKLGTSAASTAITARKTDAEKINKEKMEALMRQEEYGALGLSTAERQLMLGEQEQAIQRQAAQSNAMRRQYLAGAAGGSGAAMEQAALTEQNEMVARERAIADVEAKNMQREIEQRQELEDRIGADEIRQQARREAIASTIRGGAETGAEAYGQKITLEGQKGDYSQQAADFGMSEAELESLSNMLSDNPELMALLGGSI